MKYNRLNLAILILFFSVFSIKSQTRYPIVDTGQEKCYSNSSEIEIPDVNERFYGQDGNYTGNQSSYKDNGDGTVTDLVTGLMWQKDMGDKVAFEKAFKIAKKSKLAGYSDWRVPTIKELYSLINFTGSHGRRESECKPYIDTKYFDQPFGNKSKGERTIDAQTWSSTKYVGKTMRNSETVFGVNFIDGRIKGYPTYDRRRRTDKKMHVRLVRGNSEYGKNNFIDNGDGTISDLSTGLMWQKDDSKTGMEWEDALKYSENLNLAGHSDWRLPNAKELQSIVDYRRSPQTTNSAAIDSKFVITEIEDAEGNSGHYPFYWTGTTHLDGRKKGAAAVYISFGEAHGKMHGRFMDVHGAGAQRSDPKSANGKSYPSYHGPQGDVRIVFNFVRCVRNIKPEIDEE